MTDKCLFQGCKKITHKVTNTLKVYAKLSIYVSYIFVVVVIGKC